MDLKSCVKNGEEEKKHSCLFLNSILKKGAVMKRVKQVSSTANSMESRGGASDGIAEISWAVGKEGDAKLPCGFGRWHEAQCEPKTLPYDEIILVLEGEFGIEEADGTRLTGKPGDIFEIPKGVTIKYFGTNAKLFFVTN